MHPCPSIATRLAFSLFAALFFLAPVCTIFIPFCTISWIAGFVVLTALVYITSAAWRPANASGADGTSPFIGESSRSGR